MTDIRRKVILAAVVVFALVGLVIGLGTSPIGIQIASAMHDCKSVQTLLDSAEKRGEVHDATYREQELAACQGKPVKSSETSDNGGDESDSDEPSTPPTPTESPTATAAPENESDDTADQASEPTQPTRQFYSEASVGDTGKSAPNNFGPRVAVDPDLQGAQLNDMNVDQAKQEFKYRIARDPMLASMAGGEFGLWPTDTETLNRKTEEFIQNPEAWQQSLDAINAKIDDQSATIGTIAAHERYRTMYALNGGDAPEIRSSVVQRGTAFATVVFADGTEFKLDCGFQPVRRIPVDTTPAAQPRSDTPADMPKPAPGMTQNSEGTPERQVSVCNPDTGEMIDVPQSEAPNFPKKCKDKPSPPPTKPSTPPVKTTPPSEKTTPPPPTETTPPNEETTPPPTTPPSKSDDKCKTNKNPESCKQLPPGSGGKPQDNDPTLEPEPTHSAPSAGDPSSHGDNSDDSSSSGESPREHEVQPKEQDAPSHDAPATGDPLGNE